MEIQLLTIEQHRGNLLIGVNDPIANPRVYNLCLNKSHGIEASYITVHSYDILVIITHPWLCLGLVITKISY